MINIDLSRFKELVVSPKVIVATLGVVFLLSLAIFLGSERKTKALLFFPTDDPTIVHGDFHILPLSDTEEENMRTLLSEVLLDPFDYKLNRVVPSGVRINSFILTKERTVYVDLSIELAHIDGDTPTLEESQLMLDILEKNLLFNFKKIRNVQFSVDGEIPFTPVFLNNNS